MATLLCLRLAGATGEDSYRVAAEKTLALFGERLRSVPRAMPQMLCAVLFSQLPPLEITITGPRAAPEMQTLLRVLRERFLPHRIIRHIQHPGTTSAQVCFNRTCRLSTVKPFELARQLDEVVFTSSQ